MSVHLIVYTRRGSKSAPEQVGTACGKPQGQIQARGLEVTSTHAKVTCAECRAYIDRTGDGPESLKALLRF